MAWLAGYNYRKEITLSRASGAVTDYQMKLLVGESAGATGEDVDCGGKVQSGFHDLAFTAADGTTELKYWIESITGISPNQLATIWIKFDSIGTGDTTFYMYYGNSTLPDPIDVPTTCQWKKYPSNPVLTVGAAGRWDDFYVEFNSIWKEGSTYYGYYFGKRSTGGFKIGLATCTDGITWVKDGTADGKILDIGASGAWDDAEVLCPLVWKEGSTWYMLYAGQKVSTGYGQIGLATSSDGISWNKSGSNPVLTNGASLDTALMYPGASILKEGSTYYLYYFGNTVYTLSVNAKIMLATSTDLTTWSKSGNNPMLSGGTTSEWDTAVLAPMVRKFGSIYYMWYEGAQNDSGNFGLSYIGLATSANKDSGWSKSSANPVIGTGGGSTWDNMWTEYPILVDFGTEWRMYYGGSQGNSATPRCQGGFATYAKKGVGADTFILFDDFERVPYAAVGGSWTIVGGSPTISLEQSYGGARSCKLPANVDMTIPATISNNIAVRYRINKTDTAQPTLALGNGTKLLFVRALDTEHVDFYTGNAYTDLGLLLTNAVWQIIEIADIVLGTSIDVWVNDVRVSDNGATNWSSAAYTNVLRFATSAAGTVYLENVIVRNYRATEPAWGAWGEEVLGGSASLSPSSSPSVSVSSSPSVSPSGSPSASPSISPSVSPSKSFSNSPSLSPSASISPSISPSASSSISPSDSPSGSPSVSPSSSPSLSPSASLSPSVSPSASPSLSSSVSPSVSASVSPSASPSIPPFSLMDDIVLRWEEVIASFSPSPSVSPSRSPSASPSEGPDIESLNFRYDFVGDNPQRFPAGDKYNYERFVCPNIT